MKTPAQRRNLAVSALCAIGLSLVGTVAHAATPVSDLTRLDGAVARVGKFDPYTDGAKMSTVDPFTDGARGVQDARDPYTDGARGVQDARDSFSDGA